MPSSFHCQYLSKEREYKSYSNMKVVKARLVEVSVKGEKRTYMRMIHRPSGEERCPDCNSLLSALVDEKASQVTFLEVADFHKRYRPLDKD